MKCLFLLLSVSFFLSVFAFSFQEETQQEAVVINIEVPVRVYKGNVFIDNLSIEDFELFEEEKKQKIEAVYLIRKTYIEREETGDKKEEPKKRYIPDVSRYFVLMFDLLDYFPDVDEALDHFFDYLLLPGDVLSLVTPIRSYDFDQRSQEMKSKQGLKEEFKKILRRDTLSGSVEHRNLVQEYIDPRISRDLKQLYLERLINYRLVNQRYLLDFARNLKKLARQKYVFLFYQTDVLPVRENSFPYNAVISKSMTNVIIERVEQRFADSSSSFYFLFVSKKHDLLADASLKNPIGYRMKEFTQNTIFSIFKDIAEATGGITETSNSISSLFNKAVSVSENYYLLYYFPMAYKPDGEFRKIDVKLKGKSYRVNHRAGYVAN